MSQDNEYEFNLNEQDKMSDLLARNGKLTAGEMRAYVAQMDAIGKLSNPTPLQKAFLEDGLVTMMKINLKLSRAEIERDELRAKLESSASNTATRAQPPELPERNPGQAIFPPINQGWNHSARYTIKLNELVRKPETFDGKSPNARKWISDYIVAVEMNGWSEEIALKYFSTFLSGTALSWYKTDVKPLYDAGASTLISVERQFRDYYLGRADDEKLSLQVEEIRQKPRESIREFLPRFREMLLLLDPKMPEAEQRRRVITRLRPEYRPWLAFAQPGSITELLECCVKVEAGQANGSESTVSNDRRYLDKKAVTEQRKPPNFGNKPSQVTKEKQQPIKSPNQDQRKNPKCYRCERLGHVSKHCRASAKKDGTPCNEKPVRREEQRINNLQPSQSTENEEVLTVKHVCNSITSSDWTEDESEVLVETRDGKPSNQLNLMVSSSGQLIEKEIEVEGREIKGIVDTGASVSVIRPDAVTGMEFKKPAPSLIGADGRGIKCLGYVKPSVSITIGKTTKSSICRIAVVEGLSSALIIGLNLLTKFKICIDVKESRLFFKRESIKSGVRLIEDEIIPPRSQVILEATVNTLGSVMVVPFYFCNEVLVGNTIDKVTNNRVSVLLVNGGNRAIKVRAGTQLASYQILENESSAEGDLVARVSELNQTGELVNVGDDLSEKQIDQILHLLKEYEEAFAIAGEIGLTNLAEHEIELLEGAKPFTEPLRRRPQVHIDETRKQIRDMLEAGIIEESRSPWASAYVLAKKKTGEYRLCIDFRKLNNLTKKCAYPLPNIESCLDKLAGRKYFSQIDFSSGFWQIPMKQESRELTSFRTEDGQFQFCRMPFGLTNAPASFQRMVNALLAGFKGIGLQVFIDDVCIASDSWEEHLEMLAKLFQLVIEANLKLKSSKCTFGARKVVFLGHEISEEGIRQEPQKLRALLKMPRPTDIPGIKRALGMFSYYRKFVPNFAIIAEPLTRLTRKERSFKWGREEESSFCQIIESLARNATLVHFKHTRETLLKTDASRKGVAGVLLQKADGDWKIVSCTSRRLSNSEENYGVTDLEGLALVYSVCKFRHFLLGKKFRILVDHCALCILKERMPNSPRLRRWAILLSEYEFEIEYTKGQLHQDVDCLSRAPVNDPADQYFEEQVYAIVVPRNKFQWIVDHDEPESKAILEKARHKLEDLRLSNDVVYKGTRMYIPLVRRADVVKEGHLESGHGGIAATKERLDTLWWPTKDEDITKFVSSCDICQAQKAERAKASGNMYHHEVYECNSLIAIDCFGPISATLKGNKHVIVAIDAFSKFVEARAVPDVTAATFIDFLTDYCGRHGVPQTILTDNATTFTASMVSEVLKVFSIRHKRSAPEHSQGNAVAERSIQTLQEKVALLANETGSKAEWDIVLPIAVLSINTTRHRSTGLTPYEMTFGRRQPLQLSNVESQPIKPQDMHAQLIQRHLDECRVRAIENQSDANLRSRSYYLDKRRELTFEVGQLVLVKVKERSKQKLEPRYEGPYEVIEKSNDIYKIKSLATGTTKIRHISKLKLYSGEPREEQSKSQEINYIREGMTSGRPTVWPTVLLLIATMVVLGSSMIVFERVAPIVWTRTNNYVDKGLTRYRVEIHYINPCAGLMRIAATQLNVKAAVDHCSRLYTDLIVNPIRDFAETSQALEFVRNARKRNKRFIVEFLSGMFFSNVIKTYVDKIWPDKGEIEIGERQKVVADKLSELVRSLNTTELILQAVSDSLMHTHEVIRKTNERLSIIALESPDLAITAAFIVSKIMLKSHLIGRLRYNFRSQKIDLDALSQLIESDWLDEVHEGSAVARNVESPASGVIRLEFSGRKEAKESGVHRVDAFRFWTNLTESPSLMEYTGERFLVYNSSANCIKSIPEPTQAYVSVQCDREGYGDTRLSKWQKVYSVESLTDQYVNTTIKESYPYMFIYCITQWITIMGHTTKCPPYVFRLNATIPWNASDYVYEPSVDRLDVDDSFRLVDSNVHEVHFRGSDHLVDENSAIEKIAALKKELVAAQLQAIAITLPTEGGGLSYATATRILIYSISIVSISFLGIAIYCGITGKKRHETIMKTVTDGIHGDGTYETIKLKSSNNSNVSSNPNVINVNLREFVSKFGSNEI